MVKNSIILLIAHFFILSGCVSIKETVEKKDPVPKVTVGMPKAEVLKILNRPDFTSSSEGQTIFFYCTYLIKDTSKGICIPIFFKDEIVVEVGEKDSQKWTLDMVQSEVAAGKVEKIVKKEKKIAKKETYAKPLDGIAEETLDAQKTYTPNKGDTVYVNYHSNFIRYIQLRSNPSNNSKILRTLCIGSELDIMAVRDSWLYVKGVDKIFIGWILKQWVTNDRTVKIDAEKRRIERAPEIVRLEAIVKPIPQSEWRENLRLYEKLLELDPCNLYYQRKVEFYVNYGRKLKKRKRK